MNTVTAVNWHWKITLKDITEIKAGNRETINRVYLENLSTFRRIARKYCRNSCNYDLIEDCVNQIYIDFQSYDFASTSALFWSIRGSFRRACGSTRVKSLSINEPINEDGGTLEEVLQANSDGFDELDRIEHENNVLDIIGEQTQLTDLQRDQLTAYAFGVLLYRGIFSYEYAQAHSR